jgi:hypothetical protein
MTGKYMGHTHRCRDVDAYPKQHSTAACLSASVRLEVQGSANEKKMMSSKD